MSKVDMRTAAAKRYRELHQQIVATLDPNDAGLDVFAESAISRLVTLMLLAQDFDKDIQAGRDFSSAEFCALHDRIKGLCADLGIRYTLSGASPNGGPIRRDFRLGQNTYQAEALENYLAAKRGNGSA